MVSLNKAINTYITEVLSEIHFKNCHREIADELEEHIEDLHSDYIAEGKSEEVAWSRAIDAMGDPHQLGKEFDKVHKAPADWYISIPILGFMGINLLIDFQYLENGIFQAGQMANALSMILIGILVILGISIYFRNTKEHKMHWFSIYALLITCDILLTIYVGLFRGNNMYSYKYILTPFYILLLFILVDTYDTLSRYKKIGIGTVIFLTVLLLSVGPKLNMLLFLWSMIYVFFISKKQVRFMISLVILSTGAIMIAYCILTLATGKEYEIQRLLSTLTIYQEYQVRLQQQFSNALFGHNIFADNIYSKIYSITGEFLPANIIHYSLVLFLLMLSMCFGFYISLCKQLEYIRKDWKRNYFLVVYIYMIGRLIYCMLMNITAIPVIGATIPLTLGNPYAFICDCVFIGILINLKYEPLYMPRSVLTN